MSNLLYASKVYQQENTRTKLKPTTIRKAVAGLSEADRQIIEHSCSKLEESIHAIRKESGEPAKAMFGKTSSLELLAKIGMLLLAYEQAEADYSSFSLRKNRVIDRLFDSV